MSQPQAAPPVLSATQQNAAAKRLAREHGFTLSGVAAIPSDGQAPRAAELAAWLNKGLHGPLHYMLDTQLARSNVHSRFPWARSILALGAFYGNANLPIGGLKNAIQENDVPGLSAHIARYAHGRDYHKVFERRLKNLARALLAAGVCARAKWYTDTGPLLERAWAERAGLGWIGKNTCLIHPRQGSFCLLAAILLDSAPQPDPPAKAHCGTCTRCLAACPTQALSAPGILDARRCLATWNIESRGQTPPELWSAQGTWVAGCDVCQMVCPFNTPKRAPLPDEELTRPLPWQKMTLAECLVMTTAQFNRAFAGSALRRVSLKGLRLGALAAAGNLRAVDCEEALKSCLADADPDIRARAEWALKVKRKK